MTIFTDPKAHPLVLFRALTERYGPDWLEWARPVLQQTLEKDLEAAPAKSAIRMSMAVAAVATRDEFWTTWEHFHFLAQALNGDVASAYEIHELPVGHMMVAVDIAESIREELGALAPKPKFSEEVARFVAAQAKNAGVWYLPPPLDFASDLAAGRKYRCLECGNEGEVVFNDGVCDVCSERFMSGGALQLTSWRPREEYVQGAKNLEFFELNPTAGVKKRVDELRAGRNVSLQETRNDICAARVIAALAYLDRVRARKQGVSA